MKKRRLLAVFLAAVIAVGVFILLGTGKDNSRGTVTLWYEKDSPLAGAVEKLVKEYNSNIKREALPVETKCFETEAELAAAYETGTPDILLCSQLHAFSLYQRDKLKDISGVETFSPPVFPKSVQSRSESIGISFFPVGISIPVMLINNSLAPQKGFADFEKVFDAASDYIEKTGKPFLACSSIADLFCVYMLRSGVEFDGDFEAVNSGKQYLELYNIFAEASFEGSISYVGEDCVKYFTNGVLPCVFTSSERLAEVDLDGVSVCGVPVPAKSANSDTVGTAYGFAVTNGGSRSTRDTAAFISWVFSNDRCTKAALDCFLAPSIQGAYSGSGAAAVLLTGTVKNNIVSLPAPDSRFILNRADFEESFVREMERLMP